MIVAFDTWTLANQLRNSGIHRYSVTILNQLTELMQSQDLIALRAFSCDGYSDTLGGLKSSPQCEIISAPALRLHRSWKLAGLSFAAYRARADLIFSPSFYVCPWGPVPVVATIHDVTPITSPAFHGRRNLIDRAFLWNAAKLSRKCIADSVCTKNDLVGTYDLPPEKVSVVYLGYDKDRFNRVALDKKRHDLLCRRYGIQPPYILHHGTIQPRKNLERLIQAYRLCRQRRRKCEMSLVLAGPLGWDYERVTKMAAEGDTGDRIVLTGPLAEDELPLLVKGAAACAIPSLYEGFCLPMIEAMACGVPTVVSGTSCLPEVSGGVLQYFDPLSIEDIADKLEKVLYNDSIRAELTSNGSRRASEFSWERCARETLELLVGVYEQLAGQARERSTPVRTI